MMKSKSSATFGRKADLTDHEPPGRPRGRSTLDTFVIPGRTRFPSSKLRAPEPVDLQITQGLLNLDAFKVPKMAVNRTDKPTSWFSSGHEPSFTESPKSRRRVGGRSVVNVTPAPKPRCKQPSKTPSGIAPKTPSKIAPKTPSKVYTQEAIFVPLLYGSSEDSEAPLFRRRLNSGSSEQALNAFDGPFDSGLESLPTSGTWTTLSNRIFTDSSTDSSPQDLHGFVDEYNRLALKHGLPRFTDPPVPIDIANDAHTDIRITSKSHNNWLMRKILRRTSSSYNVKVKSTNNKRVIQKTSDRSRKDILKAKSLEEIGRLGGLSILVLPPEFAVDKLALPTCLSATATYLCQHGRTTPGVFRVPGQQATVNALYDHYAHQYSSADSSTDQVQQTIGSGLLPTHIPHSVHDVASVFKKLIAGLPGGLLGSILLFKALRSISDHLHPSPELSDSYNHKARARLVALAISSVSSALRISLIWAFLGLAALIGHEAEKAEQADSKIAGTDGKRHRRASFELMGYHSLGVVLGPLLLGDLTDLVTASDESESCGLLILSEGPKKRRKERKNEKATEKLEQSSDLIAHVERANVTARVMEMLISNWEEVVKQLRDINATRTGSHLATSRSRSRWSSANSKLRRQPSEEDLLFDFLRGRPLMSDFTGSMKVKKSVKISSSSPSSHRAIWATDSSGGSRRGKDQRSISSRKSPAKHSASELLDIEKIRDAAPGSRSLPQGGSPKLLTYSALASSEEDGLVLQHPFTSRALGQDTLLGSFTNHAELVDAHASLQPSTYQFMNGYPLSQAEQQNTTATQIPRAKTCPVFEAAPMNYQGEGPLPEQHYADQDPIPSMTTERPKTPPALDTYVDTDYTEQIHAYNATSWSSAAINPFAEEPRQPGPIRQSSVRQLAQLFVSPPPSPQRKRRSQDIARLKSQASSRHPSADYTAQVPPSPTAPPSVLQLPSLSPTTDKTTPRSGHDSLIPKPIHDLGRGRKPVPRSPSSTRSPLPSAPPPILASDSSVFAIPDPTTTVLPDHTATTPLHPRTHNPSPTPSQPTISRLLPPTTTHPTRRVNSMGPTHSLSPIQSSPPTPSAPKLNPLTPRARIALSAESLHRMRSALSEPPIARSLSSDHGLPHLHCRSATAVNLADLPAAPVTQANASTPANPATVTNATLYAEIRRLQRLLDQRTEEATQARRSLDAVRVAREGGKGTLSEELREARREGRGWEVRARWAEGRLSGLLPEGGGAGGRGVGGGEGEGERGGGKGGEGGGKIGDEGMEEVERKEGGSE